MGRTAWPHAPTRRCKTCRDGSQRFLRQAIEADSMFAPAYGMLGRWTLISANSSRPGSNPKALVAKESKLVAASTMTSASILQQQGNLPPAKKGSQEVLAVDPRAVIAANNLHGFTRIG